MVGHVQCIVHEWPDVGSLKEAGGVVQHGLHRLIAKLVNGVESLGVSSRTVPEVVECAR